MSSVMFQRAVANRFAEMSKFPLFTTTVHGDELWNLYLDSFPAGSNPIYKTNTEHDCNCCKSFIRNIGNVVAVTPDQQLLTIWDVEIPHEDAYTLVAKALSKRVRMSHINDPYMHYERSVGVAKNFEQTTDGAKAWDHFHVTLPDNIVVRKDTLPSVRGCKRESYEMFSRALATISEEG